MREATDREIKTTMRTRYTDWAAMADGVTRLATQGVDFNTTPQQFANAARRWANNHKRSVRASAGDTTVTFVIAPASSDSL
jgi:hypothetical protein